MYVLKVGDKFSIVYNGPEMHGGEIIREGLTCMCMKIFIKLKTHLVFICKNDFLCH